MMNNFVIIVSKTLWFSIAIHTSLSYHRSVNFLKVQQNYIRELLNDH